MVNNSINALEGSLAIAATVEVQVMKGKGDDAGIEAGEHHGPMVTTRGQTDHRTITIMFVGRFASKSRQFLRNGCQTERTLSIRPDFSRQSDRDG